MILNPAKHAAARTSGVRSASAMATYRIEGANVTVEEMAKRLGVSTNTIYHRMSKLRRASGPITWARLAG